MPQRHESPLYVQICKTPMEHAPDMKKLKKKKEEKNKIDKPVSRPPYHKR